MCVLGRWRASLSVLSPAAGVPAPAILPTSRDASTDRVPAGNEAAGVSAPGDDTVSQPATGDSFYDVAGDGAGQALAAVIESNAVIWHSFNAAKRQDFRGDRLGNGDSPFNAAGGDSRHDAIDNSPKHSTGNNASEYAANNSSINAAGSCPRHAVVHNSERTAGRDAAGGTSFEGAVCPATTATAIPIE